MLYGLGGQKSFKNRSKNDPTANPKLIRKRQAENIDFETDVLWIGSRLWSAVGFGKLIHIDTDCKIMFEQIENSIPGF